MPILLIRGRYVVTMDANRTIIENGAVAVDGASIVGVGTFAELSPMYPDARVEGRADDIVIPGMINGHQHLTGDRLVRSVIPDTIDSQEAIFGWAVPVHGAHTQRDDYVSAVLALNEALSHGITTTVEAGTVAHPAAVLRAQRVMGTRATLGSWGWDVGGGNDPSAPFAGSVNEVLDRQREVLSLTDGDRLVTGWVTLVGHDLMSDELVCAASQLARDNGTHLTFHLSPSSSDAASYLARTGRRPVRHLHDLGALVDHVLMAHAVHLDDDEIDCLVATDTAVAVCPWAYLRLAQGITAAGRHDDMWRRGVRLALGCDSENAGDAIDPIRNAALFAGLVRDRSMDPSWFSAIDALAIHTIGAARAIGLDHRVGSLEVGKEADIVCVSTEGPEWIPPSPEPVLQLIWASSGSAVRDVWVAGRPVVRDHRSCRLTSTDLAEVTAEATARGRELRQRG